MCGIGMFYVKECFHCFRKDADQKNHRKGTLILTKSLKMGDVKVMTDDPPNHIER